ncbi:hypothetical protein AB0C93_37605 [Streptomyces sp. NPDC048518]|uniref:hypothetical protein n=1 Tax=Streptomyces sp. NPDC048518 TaxID=3155029 RepID=UPI0033C8DCC3
MSAAEEPTPPAAEEPTPPEAAELTPPEAARWAARAGLALPEDRHRAVAATAEHIHSVVAVLRELDFAETPPAHHHADEEHHADQGRHANQEHHADQEHHAAV